MKRSANVKRFGMAVVGCMLVSATSVYAGAPKYVFLFVGDGMGLPQRAAAVEYQQKDLVIDSFPTQGLTTTAAADRFITGSAAAATALSTGVKTNIGVVGMDTNLQSVQTIAEKAKAAGMKVGIVSSVSIDHATPAAFYAHVPKRSQYYDIGVALAQSNFDYFGGGGLKDPANSKNNATKFEGNVFELAEKNGYSIVNNRKDFDNLSTGSGKVIAINSWLQDGGATPYAMDTGKNDISLAEFTEKGIKLLDNEAGFFMMVEGGKIDWACHANDAAASIHDTLAFDKAVEKAYDFYLKHPKDTLIVVTGDHETGGMTLGFAGTKYASNYDVLKNQKISFQKFGDDVVQAVKGGSYTEGFATVKKSITENFGLKFEGDEKDPMVLNAYERSQIKKAFTHTLADDTKKSKDAETYLLYGGYDPLSVSVTHILNQKAGIAWTSYKHTAVPVSTAAIGEGAEKFQGIYENKQLGEKLINIAGFKSANRIAALQN